ncbi:PD-(D/E)XK nuclease family protein [Christiangramia sabulilitoris]|uniref:PD-(D/E)XK nuclease family protein n=1 Tax=Christiangramia sabulilitoris TaxID=2583991 RepID=A0A550I8Z7_9FLAO|nr:PD-(D/E)XK nuclease family protein [Christiangramia sabulilitoris]TRO67442.1 PD-(D/E)XK nuclease family protein [Christiangramia sabulilitoris]
MKSFIREVLLKLQQSTTPLSEIVFILPSKRAGSYLIKELAEISEKNIFAPTIYSVEEFTEKISGLQTIDNTISLFEFYEVYKRLTPQDDIEDFETFVTWAQSLIQDFNEIDRYLIDHKPFFDYLSGIQDLTHWYVQEEKTELIKRYLKFWKNLPAYYEELSQSLTRKEQGYQGLIYRRAAQNIPQYISENSRKHLFIGFNALNAAEQHIIQAMLAKKCAEVYWDMDKIFYEDADHAASIFIREYLKDWEFYQNRSYEYFTENYSTKKNIQFIGVPKNIGQAKYIGEILTSLPQEKLENTAVVLGEEELLLPVLNSLPSEINELNITMGFPVKNAPLNSLFENLFQVHLNDNKEYYYKDVISILNHPSLHPLLNREAEDLLAKINTENLVYLKYESIISGFSENQKAIIKACFDPKNDSVSRLISDFHELIQILKKYLKQEEDKIGLEFLYHFHVLFNKLENLNDLYPHLKSIKSLYNFYKELLSTETLDFQGKPFKGLQLMGMLESRALDFETVIITSLNEGVLPAGKSDNSFIPYDLKQEYKLPTYREKDAVYTYHFYRLLQRAKNVYLLYNTEADGLNSGEKSRFLTQLEIEKQPQHELKKILVGPKVPQVKNKLREIKKTPAMLDRLKALAGSGFSPSALTTYVRNPLDFYHQYVLGVRDQEEVEETVAFNTLGTVVHNALENLYKGFEGQLINEEIIKSFIKQADAQISREFSETYSKLPLEKGKNLLIFEVAKRYLHNFLRFELKRLKAGEEIQIIQIEQDLKVALPIKELPFSVYLRGKVDRFERSNGIPRIIDYKTGKVESRHLTVSDWSEITKDYDNYSKSFQVLTYTSLIALQKDLKFPAEAGIVSFKNLKSGFLKFAKKEEGSRNKDSMITEETLDLFQAELKKLIMEICDPDIPFVEKEIKKSYGSF